MKKVYCKNCLRWYCTYVDQCDVPLKIISDVQLLKYWGDSYQYSEIISRTNDPFIKAVGDSLKRGKLYGHPSTMNFNNDCPFYKPCLVKGLTKIARMFQHD